MGKINSAAKLAASVILALSVLLGTGDAALKSCMAAEADQTEPAIDFEAYEMPVTMYAIDHYTEIRSEPQVHGEIIASLPLGTAVTVYGRYEDWYIVSVLGGVEYISTRLLSAEVPMEEETPDGTEPYSGAVKVIYEETNRERAAAGVCQLEWDAELAAIAEIRADEIMQRYDHVRPDGTTVYVLSSHVHGENLNTGAYTNGYGFMDGWMRSEGHKNNILRGKYTKIGIAYRHTEDRDYAVQLFGY